MSLNSSIELQQNTTLITNNRERIEHLYEIVDDCRLLMNNFVASGAINEELNNDLASFVDDLNLLRKDIDSLEDDTLTDELWSRLIIDISSNIKGYTMMILLTCSMIAMRNLNAAENVIGDLIEDKIKEIKLAKSVDL